MEIQYGRQYGCRITKFKQKANKFTISSLVFGLEW